MKLTVFHAGDGDCVLLTSNGAKPKRVLIDGGRTVSFETHTRPALAALQQAKEKLDVVYVSHIDDDHITGVLRLIEDVVEWRAHEFALTIDPNAKPPKFQPPPEIGEVWHNGLFVLVGDKLAPEVQEVLAATATLLAGSADETIRELASELSDLATGEKASMELSRRISAEQLGIPLNRATAGKLLQRAGSGGLLPGEVTDVGPMKFYLLGPSEDDIAALRKKWAAWIKGPKSDLKKLQAAMLADEERLGALSPAFVVNPIATDLGDGLKQVTEANLASLMFLVEEGNRKVLLTGDGVSSEVLEGLKRHGKLDNNGRIHVDVLKVQHHGAEANVTSDFVNAVTADHYIFCGNGASDNPEPTVVEAFARARSTGQGGKPPIKPNKKFTFWFSSSSAMPATAGRTKHMKGIEKLVATLQAADQYLDANFLAASSFDVAI